MVDKKTAAPKSSQKERNHSDLSSASPPPQQPGTLICELQKNARERLRISHTTFKGKAYVDLRVWYVDEHGDFQPSRSGVSIRPDQLGEVLRGLTLAAREVAHQGGA